MADQVPHDSIEQAPKGRVKKTTQGVSALFEDAFFLAEGIRPCFTVVSPHATVSDASKRQLRAQEVIEDVIDAHPA